MGWTSYHIDRKINRKAEIDASSDIFTGVYFDRLDMVRRIVEKCPNGFRLSSGDVVEWM